MKKNTFAKALFSLYAASFVLSLWGYSIRGWFLGNNILFIWKLVPLHVSASTQISLFGTDLQVQSISIFANELHVIRQHVKLSDKLERSRRTDHLDTLWTSVELARNNTYSSPLFPRVPKRNDLPTCQRSLLHFTGGFLRRCWRNISTFHTDTFIIVFQGFVNFIHLMRKSSCLPAQGLPGIKSFVASASRNNSIVFNNFQQIWTVSLSRIVDPARIGIGNDDNLNIQNKNKWKLAIDLNHLRRFELVTNASKFIMSFDKSRRRCGIRGAGRIIVDEAIRSLWREKVLAQSFRWWMIHK